MRLHEASKKYDLSNKDLASLLGTLGFQVKEHPFSAVGDDMLEALEKHFQGKAVGPQDSDEKPSVKTPEKAATAAGQVGKRPHRSGNDTARNAEVRMVRSGAAKKPVAPESRAETPALAHPGDVRQARTAVSPAGGG